jgi:hypothetical protein
MKNSYRCQSLEPYKLLEEGFKDIKNSRVLPAEDVFKEMESRFDR